MTGDLTPDVSSLLRLAATQVGNRGVTRRLAWAFAACDDAELAAGITQMELARLAGVTDRSVRRALRQLEAMGVVTPLTRPGNSLGYEVDRPRLGVVLEVLG